ncbi:hypothetical protein BH10CYA1_BH10CYA1_56240 [soil metagenome]
MFLHPGCTQLFVLERFDQLRHFTCNAFIYVICVYIRDNSPAGEY